ncbi:MAG: LPS export ABC transporter permease LptF [Legionellales bacterium]|nr:LPS export ABC transporter permease LptF [Legionellales bacterium]
MVITRYLVKEVSITLSALVFILMLIFMSNQFVQYLSRAAAGHLPGTLVIQLLLLETPTMLALLLPLAFYLAVLIAYGRLYAEQEMTVLNACGYSRTQLLQVTMAMALVLSLIVGAVVLWASPLISKQRDFLYTGGGASNLIQLIAPGRFQTMASGKQVLYVEQKSRGARPQAEQIFLALRNDQATQQPGMMGWDLVTASHSYLTRDEATGEEFLVLEKGQQYIGVPGEKNFRVIEFATYQARLPESKPYIRRVYQAMSTRQLWPPNNSDPAKAAELQWRLSAPLMMLVLGFIATPLSRVKPRQGKYAKLLPAIILYILYANVLFMGRDWVAKGVIPTWLGLWWLHGLLIVLGAYWLWGESITHWMRARWYGWH